MSAPSLSITVQPFDAGKAEYLPLGAKSAGATAGLKLVLRLDIRNAGPAAVRVSGIKFAYPGSVHATTIMQDINLDGSLNIAAGASVIWSNGITPQNHNNAVYLTGAAPSQVRIEISAQGFANPASITHPLAAHKSPVPGDAYRFFFSPADLRDGEYAEASAVHWANGGAGGTQIVAHDVGVIGNNSGSWSQLLPGVDGKQNAHWRIHGKPVRAMADGVVMEFFDTMEENTTIGAMPDPTPNPAGGNNILIRHGTEAVRYCHFRKNSIPAALKTVGATVLTGQELGRAGNSGNSSNPHTHIQVQRISDWALRPLPFRNAWVIDKSLLSPPSASGPWYKLNAQGIPKDAVAIWPGNTTPGFRSPAAGISISGDWVAKLILSPDLDSFSNTVQNLFDHEGLRLISVTNYFENGQHKWAGVARAASYAHRFWVSNGITAFRDHAQSLFDNDGLRLVFVHTYLKDGVRKFAGIARSGTWANRLFWRNNLSDFVIEARRLENEEGKQIILATTWAEGATRMWLGIARGGLADSTWWISGSVAEFKDRVQGLFDNEGKRLVYFGNFVEGGLRKWVGVARAESWGHRFYNRSDLDLFELQAQQYLEHEGLRLEQIDFLQ